MIKSKTLLALTLSLAGVALSLACGGDDASPPEAPIDASSDGVTTASRPAIIQQATPAATAAPGEPPSSAAVVLTFSHPFVWPVRGPITSQMGPEHPVGIDIGLDAGLDVEIRAAASGIVSFSGGSDEDSYGFHVILDHGNDIATLYGHLSERLVEEGEQVSQGDVLGIGGSSGLSNGPHLHFEVRQGDAQIDPFDVLLDSEVETQRQRFDCLSRDVQIDSGTEATLDFEGALLEGESVVGVALQSEQPTAARAEVESRSVVTLDSPIAFSGPDDAFILRLTVDDASANRTIYCGVRVHTPLVEPTFYARAPSSEEEEDGQGEGEAAATEEASAGEAGGEVTPGDPAAVAPALPTATPGPITSTKPAPPVFQQPKPPELGMPEVERPKPPDLGRPDTS